MVKFLETEKWEIFYFFGCNKLKQSQNAKYSSIYVHNFYVFAWFYTTISKIMQFEKNTEQESTSMIKCEKLVWVQYFMESSQISNPIRLLGSGVRLNRAVFKCKNVKLCRIMWKCVTQQKLKNLLFLIKFFKF